MFEVGRLCIKLAGRDARQKCVVVDVIDERFVMIDGQTRRRKCNVLHLEPLSETLPIKKGASSADVISAFKKIGVEITESKPKNAGPKPVHMRKGSDKTQAPKDAKPAKKAAAPKKVVEKKAEVADEKAEAKPKKAAPKKKVAEKKD